MITNFNGEIQKISDFAVKTAKDRFGIKLDYSENSLGYLENLAEKAYRSFYERAAEGMLSEESIMQTSKIWGSYLGEVMRRKWGGNWLIENGDFILAIDRFKLLPVNQVYQRITVKPNNSIQKYYEDFVKEYLIPQQPQTLLGVNYETQKVTIPQPNTKKIAKNELIKFKEQREWFRALLLVFGIIGIIALMYVTDKVGNNFLGCLLGFLVFILIIAFPASKTMSLDSKIDEMEGKLKPLTNPTPYKPSTTSMNAKAISTITQCRTCHKDVSSTASACPNCGEVYPGIYSNCPLCGSSNFIVKQKGFSLGKAGAGAILFGPLGLIGGFHGSNEIEFMCLQCKNTWKPNLNSTQ
jgi:RNA polymerase subunit RPABC4/transcription elongation factor Spt4